MRRLFAGGQVVGCTRQEKSGLPVIASVFDNSQEGIVITDANNVFLNVNPAFTRITGYSR